MESNEARACAPLRCSAPVSARCGWCCVARALESRGLPIRVAFASSCGGAVAGAAVQCCVLSAPQLRSILRFARADSACRHVRISIDQQSHHALAHLIPPSHRTVISPPIPDSVGAHRGVAAGRRSNRGLAAALAAALAALALPQSSQRAPRSPTADPARASVAHRSLTAHSHSAACLSDSTALPLPPQRVQCRHELSLCLPQQICEQRRRRRALRTERLR